MKQQSTRGKAFSLNQDQSIYGTFAEIGAGQETVNHFFKAGLASQTVAKSMSAYDVVFSDEIYGKQNRYVCKERLLTMLQHEYSLLQRRLKNQSSKKCFFAFANTSATSSYKRGELHKPHHSWMGIRFQAKPQTAYNQMLFHVNCLDQNRLQQREALGILGVNLIHACFHHRKNYKTLIASLMDNLHQSRVEINGLVCQGESFKHFNEALLNKELMSQDLSPVSFFNPKGNAELIADAIFKKDLLLIYKDESLKKSFFQKIKPLLKKTLVPILVVSKKEFKNENINKQIQSLIKNQFYLLIPREENLSKVTELLRTYTKRNILLLISQKTFEKDLFRPSYYNEDSFLKSLGLIFDSKTIIKVFPESKNFSVKKQVFKSDENKIFHYLTSKKKILDF